MEEGGVQGDGPNVEEDRACAGRGLSFSPMKEQGSFGELVGD